MSELSITLIVVNVLWFAIHSHTLWQQAKERDALTMKIMAKNLADYSQVTIDRAYAQDIVNASTKEPEKKPESDWVSLNEVEKDPYLMKKFAENIPQHLNKL